MTSKLTHLNNARGNPLDVLDTRQKKSVHLASLIWPPKVQMVDPIFFGLPRIICSLRLEAAAGELQCAAVLRDGAYHVVGSALRNLRFNFQRDVHR